MKKPLYTFENDKISIEDPELNLSFHETFSPLRIPEERKRGITHGKAHLEVYTHEGTPYAFGWLKNQKLDGEYLHVYPSQKTKGRQYYKDGLLHGPSNFYSPKGKLLSESWFINGQQEGRTNWYYANSRLHSHQFYHKGQWHGIQLFYYIDGTLKSELAYKEGKLHGTTRLFFPDGKLDRLLIYDAGKVTHLEYGKK